MRPVEDADLDALFDQVPPERRERENGEVCDEPSVFDPAVASRLIGCSAPHLSRVFHRVTGHSVTFYRNELRVRRVLHELEEGQRCLRSISAAYGFADQAHMTRVIARHLGSTPSALRDLLRPA